MMNLSMKGMLAACAVLLVACPSKRIEVPAVKGKPGYRNSQWDALRE